MRLRGRTAGSCSSLAFEPMLGAAGGCGGEGQEGLDSSLRREGRATNGKGAVAMGWGGPSLFCAEGRGTKGKGAVAGTKTCR